MRILIVGNLYPPVVFGGYEILCGQIVDRLRASGHDIRILTSNFGAETAPADPLIERSLELTTDFPHPGETVGEVDFKLASLQRVSVANRARTLASIGRWSPDLVFCWCLNRLGLGPLFAAEKANIPACWTINDEHPRQYAYTRRIRTPRQLSRAFAEKLVWPMSTLRNLIPIPLTIISHALRKSLVDQGVAVEHAEVIHQGISLEEFPFRPMRRADDGPLHLVYAGQLSRAKGVHTILRALAALERQGTGNFRFEIAGTGVADYEAELRKMAAEGGIAGKVAFLGRVPHEEMAAVYHRNHVLVFSSEWEEPFGLTHLEAMASGCAVISTTTGGSAELIRDGVNAIAYPAGDTGRLSESIWRLMKSPEQTARLAEGGRAWVTEHHSLVRYTRLLEDFLIRTRDGR